MIVMCPGCSGIDPELVKKEFKDEKIVFWLYWRMRWKNG